MIGVTLAGLAEGMALADRAGLQQKDVLEVRFSNGNKINNKNPTSAFQKMGFRLGLCELAVSYACRVIFTKIPNQHALDSSHSNCAIQNLFNDV